MKPVILPGTGVSATALGFGCAGLMRMPTRRERRNVIAAALDAGIGYFDVAPMYGLGVAERELAICLGDRRHDVTITTKFGIEARSGILRNPRIQGMARRMLRMFPAVRRFARRNAGTMVESRSFDVAAARASLERSLGALGVDRVAFLLLHEPVASEVGCPDELLAWLESRRDAGQIAGWGVGGEASRSADVAASFPELTPVIQFDNDAVRRQIESMPRDRVRVTFSPLQGALEAVRGRLAEAPALAARWSAATGADFTARDTVARFLLAWAHRVNSDGVVLYSTASPARMAEAVAWLDSGMPDSDALDAFVLQLDEAFRGGGAS